MCRCDTHRVHVDSDTLRHNSKHAGRRGGRDATIVVGCRNSLPRSNLQDDTIGGIDKERSPMNTIARSAADRSWDRVSRSMTAIADQLATRQDLIVQLHDGGVIAPGVFDPATARITIDASRVFPPGIDARALDFGDPRHRAQAPIALGVLSHETSHAEHSSTPVGGERQATEWATVLEEPRIESVMARTHPHTRQWLQASAAHLIGTRAPESTAEAARLLVLIGGRLLGGVLDEDKHLDLDAACAKWLTPEQIAVITEATDVAVAAADNDVQQLLRQGQRIADTLGDLTPPPHDDGLDHSPAPTGDPASTTTSGTGQPRAGGDDPSGDDSPASRTGDSTNGHTGDSTDGHTGDPDDAGRQLARALAQASADAATNMQAAAGILRKGHAAERRAADVSARAAQITGAARDAHKTRHRVTYRRPAPSERRQLRELMRRMRAAADRGVDVTRVRETAPPGRANSSELLRRAAQRATGAQPTATPWSRTVRREREQPRLVVGVAADISPSMRAQVDQVGVATWMLAHVARDRGGQAATVTWHSSAAQLPAQIGGGIPVPNVEGSSRGLPAALQALDGILGLARCRSSRVVAVITDAQLPNHDDVHSEVRRLVAAGVHVLWLVADPNPASADYMEPPVGVTAAVITDPARLADVIATAALQALSAS